MSENEDGAATAPQTAPAARAEGRPRAVPECAKAFRPTREWVLERLVSNVNRAMQAEAVTLRGAPTGEYRYDGSVANRALELIGKELGLFGERKDEARVERVVSGEPLTPEEWEKLYARKG